MKTVLFLSYYFPPLGGAPTQRSLKFARYLPEEGYSPIILTTRGASGAQYSPQDHSLFGEVSANVAIHRVASAAPGPQHRVPRLVGRWLSLPSAFSRWWMTSAKELGNQILSSAPVDLIYASMSPFESANVAADLSARHAIPWVADLRDAWALDEIQVYPSILHKRVALARMGKLLSTASTVIMNTPEATAALRRTFPGLKRSLTITNGYDSDDFERAGSEHAGNQKFTIVHAGHFLTEEGPTRAHRRFYERLGGAVPGVDLTTRSPFVLFRAIDRWCSQDPSVREHLEIVFAGSAPGRSDASPELQSISPLLRFTGYIPRNESLRLVSSADLLFLPMHNVPAGQRSTSAPSKLYEYMASGRPILAAVPDSDARDFLAAAGKHYLCRPDDVDAMAAALRSAFASWKANKGPGTINTEFVKSFERRKQTTALAREFDAVLGVGIPERELVALSLH